MEYELDQRFCSKDGTTLRLQDATGDLVGSIVADRYHVLRKLGGGGMGQVYLAEHVKMGRKSALKVMNPSLVKEADAISRFNREAANASHINHPHVADVYDFGETKDGIIYLAMEFVDGPSLTKLVEDEGPLPPLRAAAITRQAADALAAAHDMGIVHRDLKPDNIMIARDREGADCVKVVDFGIAKAAENPAQKVTKTGLVVGTPEYMSPEQLAGDKLDGRSDIYALGLVAFNMLTDRLPFPAETAQESMIMRLTERPRRLTEMRPEVAWSASVQAVLDRALERDPAARYASASEFGRDFAQAVESMVGSGIGNAHARRVSETQLIDVGRDPIPATRVAGGRLPSGQVPARLPAEGGRGRETDARRRRALFAAAGAALVFAAVASTAVMLNRGERRAAGGGVTPSGNATSQKGAAPDTISRFGQRLESDSAIDVDARLDSFEKLNVIRSNDESDARRVLNGLKELKNVAMTDAQRVHATLLRAEAQAVLGQTSNVCDMVRSVRDVAAGTRYEARVRQFLINGCT
jgi:serine/threonine-protein kinase